MGKVARGSCVGEGDFLGKGMGDGNLTTNGHEWGGARMGRGRDWEGWGGGGAGGLGCGGGFWGD